MINGTQRMWLLHTPTLSSEINKFTARSSRLYQVRTFILWNLEKAERPSRSSVVTRNQPSVFRCPRLVARHRHHVHGAKRTIHCPESYNHTFAMPSSCPTSAMSAE